MGCSTPCTSQAGSLACTTRCTTGGGLASCRLSRHASSSPSAAAACATTGLLHDCRLKAAGEAELVLAGALHCAALRARWGLAVATGGQVHRDIIVDAMIADCAGCCKHVLLLTFVAASTVAHISLIDDFSEDQAEPNLCSANPDMHTANCNLHHVGTSRGISGRPEVLRAITAIDMPRHSCAQGTVAPDGARCKATEGPFSNTENRARVSMNFLMHQYEAA